MKELIFATGNLGKLKEVSKIFSNDDIKILSLKDFEDIPEIIEDGLTFEDNAFIKAEVIFNLFGKPVISDDSGLSIEQLNGEPGVISARYAGENCTYEDNNNKVINALKDFPEPHKAKFVSCALYFNGNEKIISIGELNGEIIKNGSGSNGFGYDPIFIPDGFTKTLAEMTTEEKNEISHRGIAFRSLRNKLIERKIL